MLLTRIPDVRKLGELKMDFSGIKTNTNSSPSQRNVKIGQIVQADVEVVEFVAMLGNQRTIGVSKFEYAAVEESIKAEKSVKNERHIKMEEI
jgi:hypothetical protein